MVALRLTTEGLRAVTGCDSSRCHLTVYLTTVAPGHMCRADTGWMSSMTLDLREVREIVARVFARQDVLAACGERKLGPVLDVLSHHGISQTQITCLTGIPQGRLSEY